MQSFYDNRFPPTHTYVTIFNNEIIDVFYYDHPSTVKDEYTEKINSGEYKVYRFHRITGNIELYKPDTKKWVLVHDGTKYFG